MLDPLDDTSSRIGALAGRRPSAPRRNIRAPRLTARLDTARTALAHAIEDVCSRLAHKARRAGCTLADKRPEDITAEDVAKHLVACDACVKSLDAVTAQREALVVLGSPRDPGASRVAALVSEAQGKGKQALATFLAELARACLLQIPEVRERSESILEPDEAGSLRTGATELAARSSTATLPPLPAIDSRWIAVAEAAIHALAEVEGDCARVAYYRAHVAMASSDWVSAREQLQAAMAYREQSGWYSIACHSMVKVLSELSEHQAVLAHCHDMLRAGVAPRAAWFGLWRTNTILGNAEQRDVAAMSFRDSPIDASARATWASQIRIAAEELSAPSGLSVDFIHESLGLHHLEGEVA